MIKNFKNFIIIADDLTGTGDIGFFTSKYKKILSQKIINFDENTNLKILNLNYNILIINTNTRFDEKYVIEKKLKHLFYELFSKNLITDETLIFKKIDSTLRGNFAIEIDIINSILSYGKLYLIPSYPEYKRWVKNKNLYIDNLLLEETIFSNDPKNPIKTSFIPKIIENQLQNNENVKNFIIENIENIYEFKEKIKNILEKDEKKGYKFYAGSARFLGEIFFNLYQENFDKFNVKLKNFVAISGSFNPISIEQNIFFIKSKNLNIINKNDFCEYYSNLKNIDLFKSLDIKIENYPLQDFIKYIKSFIYEKNLENSVFILYGGATAELFVKIFNIKTIDVVYPFDFGITICKTKIKNYLEENIDFYFILKSGGFGKTHILNDIYNKFIDF